MSKTDNSMDELHEVFSILQFIDVGLIVINRDYQISLWNGFMENHSGKTRVDVDGKTIFSVFPEVNEALLRRKVESVFHLKNHAFTLWKQHSHFVRFESTRPITGQSEKMFQNLTIFPLINLQGEVDKVCLMIYDVTDTALREQEFISANKQLEQLSQVDGLTQLLNRATWEGYLNLEFKRVKRSHAVSALVMFDIDHFKKVNDTHGHQAGDEVIRTVASLLSHHKRETDIAGRYGGEEFCVILPDTPTEGGMVFCERLRKAIEAAVIFYEDVQIPITVSLGVAEVNHDDKDALAWLSQSDQALYASKEGGRNMSSVFRIQDNNHEAGD